MEKIDPWFIQVTVMGLLGYFLWSIRNILSDFKDQVKGLKDNIGKLFDSKDDHEKRLSKIEGRCDVNHGPGGRRSYDPVERQ